MKLSLTHRFLFSLKKFLAVAAVFGMAQGLTAQGTCQYTIEMFDSFGDGWNDAELTVISNGNETTYTLETGDFGTASFSVTDGTPLVLSWMEGVFPGEASFNIIDPEGMLVFAAVGPIPDGEIYNELGECPSCLSPFDAYMSDVNADNAEMSWTAPDGYSGNYIIEYDTLGFTLGEGQMLTVPYPGDHATLAGLAENTTYEAYVFLDCGPDSSNLVGPFEFHTLWLNDVGVSNITSPNGESCILGPAETVTIEMTNFGQNPQTLFEFYFAVNGQAASIPVPQDGLFTGVIGNDSTQSISFETTWDFSEPGLYVLEAWTQLEGDSMPANDTFRVEVATAFPKPVFEDFETGEIPTDWTSNGFVYGPGAHGNPTWVWGFNLYSFNPESSLTTSMIGPVETGDSLTFDYRFVDFASNTATDLGPGDMLEVQISEDCGETFETAFTIDAGNHVPSEDMANRTVFLDEYEGKPIALRFFGTHGTGDYWLDLDNINVSGCPVSFGILSEITGTMPGAASGEITVTPSFGTAPFTFEWDNGGDTETISGLTAGQYTVTITDANGCEGSQAFEVGLLVSAEETAGVEQVMLFPNPTSGLTTLDVSLTEAMDFQVRVLDLSGRVVFHREEPMTAQFRDELDLSGQPTGMYILQIIADGKPHYAKLMVAR